MHAGRLRFWVIVQICMALMGLFSWEVAFLLDHIWCHMWYLWHSLLETLF